MTGSAPEMAVVVRHAGVDDAAAVARAVAALLTDLGATPPDTAAMEDAARAVIDTGDAVLLAEEDGALVGVLAASWITTVHAGGMYQWDSAAPVAVAHAAGLVAVRLDGSPLRYNRPDPSLPDLLVCRPELKETILTAIAGG